MELISVFNLETGQVGKIRRDWFEHPVINSGILVEAEEGQKSYAPELYKSRLDQDGEEEEELPFEEPEISTNQFSDDDDTDTKTSGEEK